MENELNWDKLQNLINSVMTTNELITHITLNRSISITRNNYQVLPDIIHFLKISYKIFPVTVINSQLGTSILSENLSIDTFIDELIENFDIIFEEPVTSNDITYIFKFDSIQQTPTIIDTNWNPDWCKDVNWEK